MAKLGIGVYFLATFMVWWTKCDTVVAKAEIQCYCTTPQCQANDDSNMCTSTQGKCFSQIALTSDLKDIHGCTEQLDSIMRTSCLQNGDGDIISTKKDSAYALMCCKGNMCNYLDTKDRPYVDIVNGNVNAANGSTLDASHRGSSHRNHPNNKQTPDMFYSSKELWFKAAVIAVPIAGGFILVLLVVLAIRMLRHDNRRHREYKHNQSLAKAQLYVADHFYNPNNKLLCNNEDEYKTVIPQECVYSTTSNNEQHQPLSRDCSNNINVNNTTILNNTNSIGSSNNSSIQHQHQQHSQDVNSISGSDSSCNTQKYTYEKLRESAGFENPCDSVIVWTGQDPPPSRNPANCV